MFDNKTILVTGGTGSFGKRFTSLILKRYPLNQLLQYAVDTLIVIKNSIEFDNKLYYFF